jgi:hypothetical protein
VIILVTTTINWQADNERFAAEKTRLYGELNGIVNQMVDYCFASLPNKDPSCTSLRQEVAESCASAENNLDACKDGRVDQYYSLLSQVGTDTIPADDLNSMVVPVQENPVSQQIKINLHTEASKVAQRWNDTINLGPLDMKLRGFLYLACPGGSASCSSYTLSIEMLVNNTSDEPLEIDGSNFAVIDLEGRRLGASNVSLSPYCDETDKWSPTTKDGDFTHYSCGITHDDVNDVWYQDGKKADYIDFMFMEYYTKLAPSRSAMLNTWMYPIDMEGHILEINYAGEKEYLFLMKD